MPVSTTIAHGFKLTSDFTAEIREACVTSSRAPRNQRVLYARTERAALWLNANGFADGTRKNTGIVVHASDDMAYLINAAKIAGMTVTDLR